MLGCSVPGWMGLVLSALGWMGLVSLAPGSMAPGWWVVACLVSLELLALERLVSAEK